MSESVSIDRGESEVVEIGIDRDRFSDAVAVSMQGLPAGVHVDEATKSVDGNIATFLLHAAPDADRVKNHEVEVSARGPEGMVVSEPIKLTVRD